ncbi:hypothetical protein P872_14100 [Rhodonellum psychrophilum GCM71 = DSM 17998]|uniref:Uncharacterized protein n=2 Tax=Rhodonellum TaxID=336827 RepID=U5BW97_9BACT|nr:MULTISPECIES: hypothetical protein [Rhodonellum]ERM80217.1 hypothetical protein P872_14100 [Rhodonellum psychrophilum GCM71 = DSM 17998]SDZ35776.1 hypothetical protein SAMN05444412_11163 [Rhodonellum ikkaensis]
MGKVNATGYSKIFQGVATDPLGNVISDFNSIQSAVQGTSNTPANVTKNFQVICNNAKLDMFWPTKRTTLPIAASQFKNYPVPTITMNASYFKYDSTSGALDLQVFLNNKVGFPINLTIRTLVTTTVNSTNQKDITLTIPAGSTYALFIFEFVTGGWGTSEPYIISYLTSNYTIYQPANLTGTITRQSTVPSGTRYAYFISSQGFACYTPPVGTANDHFWQGALQVGTPVKNANGTNAVADTYIAANGSFIYSINSSGTVSAFSFCQQV